MVDKLTESEMIMPYVMGQKINELIDAYNDHRHYSYDSYGTKIETTTKLDQKESPPS